VARGSIGVAFEGGLGNAMRSDAVPRLLAVSVTNRETRRVANNDARNHRIGSRRTSL